MIGHWWVAGLLEQENGKVLLVSWLFWVIFSICLHELSHGWTALRLGDQTPRITGHMTWNPIVHMGPISLIALALIGFAWGAMPVDPSRLRGRYGDAIVAFAGPAMNLSLAVTASLLAAGWVLFAPDTNDRLYENVWIFLRIGVILNLLLAMFNLLPVPPLDGSRILASFWDRFDRFVASEHGPPFMIMGFIGAIMITRAFFFPASFELGDALINGFRRLLEGPAG